MRKEDDNGYYYDGDDEKSYNRKRWALLIISLIVFVACIAIFSICIWIRFDLDFWEWCVEIEWYTYWYCTYYVMITLIIVGLTSLLTMYGVLFEQSGTLGLSFFLYILCWFMDFIGAIIICLYGVEESETLITELNEVFLDLIFRMEYDDRARRILKIIQEYVRCCGADGSDDYINANKPVPWECRDRTTGSEYAYGCQQSFAWYIEPWTAAIAGTLVTFLVIHIIQMVLCLKLVRKIKQQREAY